jgi:hypothetical protein
LPFLANWIAIAPDLVAFGSRPYAPLCKSKSTIDSWSEGDGWVYLYGTAYLASAMFADFKQHVNNCWPSSG